MRFIFSFVFHLICGILFATNWRIFLLRIRSRSNTAINQSNRLRTRNAAEWWWNRMHFIDLLSLLRWTELTSSLHRNHIIKCKVLWYIVIQCMLNYEPNSNLFSSILLFARYVYFNVLCIRWREVDILWPIHISNESRMNAVEHTKHSYSSVLLNCFFFWKICSMFLH